MKIARVAQLWIEGTQCTIKIPGLPGAERRMTPAEIATLSARVEAELIAAGL